MRILLAALLMLCALPAQAATYELYKTAVLRGVDKITGRVEEMQVGNGESVRFGTLYITARSCQKTPPEEQPEASAFLEIDELRQGQQSKRWFSGWMFASSAALSPLQHPVYDIWVIDCKLRVETEADKAAEAPTPAAPVTEKMNEQ